MIEEALELGIDRILTAARTGLDIAVVHAEGQTLAIHIGDQVGNASCRLDVRAGQVAPQTERVAGATLVVVPVAVGDREAGRGGGEQRGEKRREKVFMAATLWACRGAPVKQW